MPESSANQMQTSSINARAAGANGRRRSKRIALIANRDYYVAHFGISLISKLVSEGYEVMVLAGDTGLGPKIESVGATFALPVIEHPTSLVGIFRARSLIRAELRNVRVDIVHCFTLGTAIISAWCVWPWSQVVVIGTVSGLGRAYHATGLRAKALHAVLLACLRLGYLGRRRALIFQNSDDARYFGCRDRGQTHWCRLIPGAGVDTTRFRPSDQAPTSSRPEDHISFLFAGRLLTDKGVAEFYEAATELHAQFPQAVFRMAGSIDHRNPAAVSPDLVAELSASDSIEFLGQVEDMPRLLLHTDVLVLPSHFGEGMPTVVCEAAACAVPAIVTDVPGSRDAVVDGHTGLIVEPRDSRSLANAMQKLIIDRESLRCMGSAASSRAMGLFAASVINDATLSLYDSKLKVVDSTAGSKQGSQL